MSQAKVKFAFQLAPDVLEALRQMSAKEGWHMQAILDEDLRAYIEEKQGVNPVAMSYPHFKPVWQSMTACSMFCPNEAKLPHHG